MPNFTPMKMNFASLGKEEKHILSFFGRISHWTEEKKYIVWGPTTGYTPDASAALHYSGHLTNQRLILEADPFMLEDHTYAKLFFGGLGALTGLKFFDFMGMAVNITENAMEKPAENFSDKKYVDIPIADIRKFMRYYDGVLDVYFWAVTKDTQIDIGIPFILYAVTPDNKPDERVFGNSEEYNKEVADKFESELKKFCPVEKVEGPMKFGL